MSLKRVEDGWVEHGFILPSSTVMLCNLEDYEAVELRASAVSVHSLDIWDFNIFVCNHIKPFTLECHSYACMLIQRIPFRIVVLKPVE